MTGGFATSLLVFAVGAILDFAVTVSPYQHGFDIHTVGLILMIVGAVGGVIALIGVAVGAARRGRRTVVQDAHGNVVRSEETYT